MDWRTTPYVATKRFKYGTGEVFQGQYVAPEGERNDNILFGADSRWFQQIHIPAKQRDEYECIRCGRHFQFEGQLRVHQQQSYAGEQHTAERVAELNKQAHEQIVRNASTETMADLAAAMGHNVEEGRGGVARIKM